MAGIYGIYSTVFATCYFSTNCIDNFTSIFHIICQITHAILIFRIKNDQQYIWIDINEIIRFHVLHGKVTRRENGSASVKNTLECHFKQNSQCKYALCSTWTSRPVHILLLHVLFSDHIERLIYTLLKSVPNNDFNVLLICD